VVKVAEKKKLDTYLASPSNPCTTQTLSACPTRRIVSSDILSSEHKLREDAVIDMFIDIGCPVTLIDNDKFKRSYVVLESKF